MKWLSRQSKDALVSGGRHISYDELIGQICWTGANRLGARRPGDRVAIIGANCPEWVLSLYSIWHVKATAVPIDFMSTPEEIAYILSDCEPVSICCDIQAEAKVRQAFALMTSAPIPLLRFDSFKPAAGGAPEAVFTGDNPDTDVALIVYTSGTTGNPKGVMLTFGNLKANTDACCSQIHVFIPDDRVLVVLPLHHTYPLMASVVMPMTIGATAVFAESMTGTAIMAALQENKCTFIVGVPRLLEIFRNSMMQKINASLAAKLLFRVCGVFHSLGISRLVFKKVQQAFGGHIRYISCGGAAVDPQIVNDFYTLGFELLEGYGMTETAPMICFTPPGDYRPGSPGRAIPCNEVKVENGEVCVRGKNVMIGYYRKPEEPAKAIDADGLLHTGDLGRITKDGFIYLTGRSKELIILGNGKNIAPDELEQKLMQLNNGLFAECAVADDGHNLLAVVVPDLSVVAARGIVNIRDTVMDSVIEPYNEAVPSYKRIQKLVVWNNPLPRTRLGKLRRHILRQQLDEAEKDTGTTSQAAPPDTPEYKKVAHCLEALAGRPVYPDEHFEIDLNLDSLAKLSLLSDLNQEFGERLQIEMLAKYPTARTLAAFLAEAPDSSGTAPDAKENTAEGRLPGTRWTHGLWHILVSACMRTISHVTVGGRENIPDSPCIFAPDHQSILDAFYLISAISRKRFHDTYFYAISKFVESGLAGFLARGHNVIAMEINGDLRQSLGLLGKALSQGKSVVIFPEGTRSMDGSLADFKSSFVLLAKENNVPIVPVAITGSFQVLPRQQRWPHFGRPVFVDFLPPRDAAAGEPADLAAQIRTQIADAMAKRP